MFGVEVKECFLPRLWLVGECQILKELCKAVCLSRLHVPACFVESAGRSPTSM